MARVERRGNVQRLTVHSAHVVQDLQIGASINIAGACQTAVAVDSAGFAVESVSQTLQGTTLGALRPGDPVNLERALRMDSRLGGHLVLGHVDAVGRIADLTRRDSGCELSVEAPDEVMRYVAPKGSVAVDGISLTVVEVTEGRFTVAVIPHTFENTTLGDRLGGDQVNLEADVIARYLERLMAGGQAPGGLTWDDLRGLGY